MNKKGFEEQIDLYRSITLEDIQSKLEMGFGFTSTIIKLAGTSDAWACKICNFYSNNYSCENCIYDELNRKSWLPEKVSEVKKGVDDSPCHTESYDKIFEADSAKELLDAFKVRADYVEKCLNIYRKEVKNGKTSN